MNVQINADLSGLAKYVGAVDGIIEAMKSPAMQDDFLQDVMNSLRQDFYWDSIAAKESGRPIGHMFEWDANGELDPSAPTTNEPLFLVNTKVQGGMRVMDFDFLPSTELVPLPDAGYYGIDSSIISELSRHVFHYKAAMMESGMKARVSPYQSRFLFIPDESKKRGFYTTPQTTKPRSGGPHAAGAFTAWWTEWFAAHAQRKVSAKTRATEEVIARTGRSVMRYAAGSKVGGVNVGGRFATHKSAQIFGYAKASKGRARAAVARGLDALYSDADDYGDEF